MYFPTRGARQTLAGEITIPGSDLEYYKIGYRHQHFFPIVEDSLTLAVKLDIGYGDSYGDTKVFPFYENYFAGGPKSVRGFKDYSLGPKGTPNSKGGGYKDPIGGQLKTVGNIELYFPPPFSIGEQSMRFSAFVDVGNVFKDADSFNADDLRASAGLSMVWLSPVGPLGISVAEPLSKKKGDKDQVFQFTLGSAF
jgi:outer membrane protein insertion porin family